MEKNSQSQVSAEMNEFLEEEQAMERWNKAINQIFNGPLPSFCEWADKEEIISLINIIGTIEKCSKSNFTYVPFGQLRSLYGAAISNEADCIELLTWIDPIIIVKPLKLMFHKFGDNNELSFFRLDTLEMAHTGLYDNLTCGYEILCEYTLRNYGVLKIDNMFNEERHYNLPVQMRLVARNQAGGAFVSFALTSPYVKLHTAKIGTSIKSVHTDMTSQQFISYIEELAKSNGLL
jgi:hypothetical protein